ncbi:MAG: class I SAM-dependent methyltransferase [Lachnospiraceae bacterium]|nr:class I SAM-dependent methyltransferase [Lachnospiraceae bacterium]
MSAYTGFSEVYDLFMDNIEYDMWGKYIISLLKEYCVNDGIVLDMGCGTGNITEILAKEGYDMIGIDNSYDMLSVAMEKRSENGLDEILYLCQDMREFELYGTVRAVVSVCDCMNYILDRDDMISVLKHVNNYLDPKGVFIFDLKTDTYYKKLGDKTIAENRDESSFIWENTYYDDEKINEYILTIYTKREDEMYERIEEFHQQKAYGIDEIKALIEEAGMEFVCAYNAFTREDANEENDRIYIIARENGK